MSDEWEGHEVLGGLSRRILREDRQHAVGTGLAQQVVVKKVGGGLGNRASDAHQQAYLLFSESVFCYRSHPAPAYEIPRSYGAGRPRARSGVGWRKPCCA